MQQIGHSFFYFFEQLFTLCYLQNFNVSEECNRYVITYFIFRQIFLYFNGQCNRQVIFFLYLEKKFVFQIENVMDRLDRLLFFFYLFYTQIVVRFSDIILRVCVVSCAMCLCGFVYHVVMCLCVLFTFLMALHLDIMLYVLLHALTCFYVLICFHICLFALL